MSSRDQIKGFDNSAPVVERLNIPWSQQVDEECNENLASLSPKAEDVYKKTSTQFQYSPFDSKENQSCSTVDHSMVGGGAHSDNDFNKFKYGYNDKLSKRNSSYQPNEKANRRITSENTGFQNNKYFRRAENKPSIRTLPLEESESSTSATVVNPKKMTWASIASQPAKPAMKISVSTMNQKKKGLGMPPPPMVPGKHNLDVNLWDLPNENTISATSLPNSVDLSSLKISSGSESSAITTSEQHYGSGSEKIKGTPQDYHHKDASQNSYMSSENFERSTESSQNNNINWTIKKNFNVHETKPDPESVDSHRYTTNRYETPFSFDMSSTSLARGDFNDASDIKVSTSAADSQLLKELCYKNNYNPIEFDLKMAASARFFVIKSYSEDDIHRSIKYEIWCSTDHGNKKLDDAFKERGEKGGSILLLYSVNGSGHFCGVAKMMTPVDYDSVSSVWSQDKWKGNFKVKWIYVKDVPNAKLRHIKLNNNENKSVTHSRDTQEVPLDQGIEVLQILHSYEHKSSIFDDFSHYERKQEEEVTSKRSSSSSHIGMVKAQTQSGGGGGGGGGGISRSFARHNDDRDQRDNRINSNIINQRASGSRDRHFGRGFNSYDNYSDYSHSRTYDNHRMINDSANNLQKDKDIVDKIRSIDQNAGYSIHKTDYCKKERLISKPKTTARERNFIMDTSDNRFRNNSGNQRYTQRESEQFNAGWVRSSEY